MLQAARMGSARHNAANDAGKTVAADWSTHWRQKLYQPHCMPCHYHITYNAEDYRERHICQLAQINAPIQNISVH